MKNLIWSQSLFALQELLPRLLFGSKEITDWSQERLQEAFEESGVKLLDLLPEAEKNESVLAKVLADHGLMFLMPLLSIKENMEAQLESDDAMAFARWIGDNVESRYWFFSQLIPIFNFFRMKIKY